MAQSSKYTEDDFSKAVNAINIALEAQDTPTDLALMALGEAVILQVKKAYDKPSQEKVIEQFTLALKSALK
ncbi:hypothetical protein C2869_13755 [Saccharobesus litoralis]|uniref:Uncharacterized protein n=1 Tax=Saccharobesus litoralis TaxID=2172099 RepID=A0A2S0VTA2_9ALTE|nr:DUF1414 domain-containing protein [Saccharobesus litoralis]AWB67439.1 hypothetical protein C2869_13755 [Saccharobesus litoralis]